MGSEPIDALVDAAPEGVDADGLEAGWDAAGYRLAVPGASYEALSESAFREAAARHETYVAEWYFWQRLAPQAPNRWSFLRWLEDAGVRSVPERRDALGEGVSRTWGQLRVTATADDDGRRSYEVRHRADAEVPLGDLETRDDPAEASDVARYDDRGRYRPLSTAPTLRTGWAFVDLDAPAVVRTVDGFYPATIANWHSEREGELDVTHWREAAERQTGIYDVVDELEGSQVERLAEACCVDSQCLKRRQWDEDDGGTLDVSRGEGTFPCREPCSLVVAAAREFALAERDDEPADVALSDAERAQLRRILDAVADGELTGIRDGDVADGANRYRARYLRAKLAERGALEPDAGDGGE